MSSKLTRFVLRIAVIGMAIYIIFLSLPNNTKQATKPVEVKKIEQQIKKEIYARADIDIAKKILETKLTNAKLMIENANSEVEYILQTITGEYKFTNDKSPEDNIADWLVDSSISVDLKFKAILSIPSNKVTTTIDKNGLVMIDYNKSDIEIKVVEITQYNLTENKQFFGKKYTNAELFALIELGQDRIKEKLYTDDNINKSSLVLESHLKELARKFNVVGVCFNNQYIESTGSFKYIDNGNVKYGHPNKPMTEDIQYIVIHSTLNPNTDAEAHLSWLNKDSKSNSAHYYVDNNSIINTLDNNMYGWHTGNEYNNKSIGIEICEFDDKAKQLQSIANTKELIDILQGEFPNAKVVLHKELSSYSKSCPNLVYGNKPMFTEQEFMNLID